MHQSQRCSSRRNHGDWLRSTATAASPPLFPSTHTAARTSTPLGCAIVTNATTTGEQEDMERVPCKQTTTRVARHWSASSLPLLFVCAWLCLVTVTLRLPVGQSQSSGVGTFLKFPSGDQPRNASWPPRSKHCSVVVDDTLIIIGGYGGSKVGYLDDVYRWSSPSIGWSSNVATGARFSPRLGHDCAYYAGQIWLVAGDDGVKKNDVWSSPDAGATWVAHGYGPFEPRQYPTLLVHDGALWMAGGSGGTEFEIWRSESPGSSWSLVPISGNQRPSVRISPAFGVIGSTMYVVGGKDTDTCKDAYSFDASTGVFTKLDNYPGPPNMHGGHEFHKGKLVMIGGRTIPLPNTAPVPEATDVMTFDGSTWTREPASPLFAISWPGLVSYRNTLLVMGGDTGLDDVYNEVFVTSDDYLTPTPPPPPTTTTPPPPPPADGSATGPADGGVVVPAPVPGGDGSASTGGATGGNSGGNAGGGLAATSTSGALGATDSWSTAWSYTVTGGSGGGGDGGGGGGGGSAVTGGGGEDSGAPGGAVIGGPNSGEVATDAQAANSGDSGGLASWVIPVVIVLGLLLLFLAVLLAFLCRRRRARRAEEKRLAAVPLATHRDVESGWISARAQAAAAQAKKNLKRTNTMQAQKRGQPLAGQAGTVAPVRVYNHHGLAGDVENPPMVASAFSPVLAPAAGAAAALAATGSRNQHVEPSPASRPFAVASSHAPSAAPSDVEPVDLPDGAAALPPPVPDRPRPTLLAAALAAAVAPTTPTIGAVSSSGLSAPADATAPIPPAVTVPQPIVQPTYFGASTVATAPTPGASMLGALVTPVVPAGGIHNSFPSHPPSFAPDAVHPLHSPLRQEYVYTYSDQSQPTVFNYGTGTPFE